VLAALALAQVMWVASASAAPGAVALGSDPMRSALAVVGRLSTEEDAEGKYRVRLVRWLGRAGHLDEIAPCARATPGWRMGMACAEGAQWLAVSGRSREAAALLAEAEAQVSLVSEWRRERTRSAIFVARTLMGQTNASGAEMGFSEESDLLAVRSAQVYEQCLRLTQPAGDTNVSWPSGLPGWTFATNRLAVGDFARAEAVLRHLARTPKLRLGVEPAPWADAICELAHRGWTQELSAAVAPIESLGTNLAPRAEGRTELLTHVVRCWAALGDRVGVDRVLAAMQRSIPGMDEPYEALAPYAAMGAAWHVAGNRDAAEAWWLAAIRCAAAHPHPRARVEGLLEICFAHQLAGVPFSEAVAQAFAEAWAGVPPAGDRG
jgi:hypothetical protein